MFDREPQDEPRLPPASTSSSATEAPARLQFDMNTRLSSDDAGSAASTQWQLVRGVLEEMMQSFKSEINSQIQNLHLEMIRQFQLQQLELEVLFDRMSVRKEMIDEIKRLRDENERLRNMY